MISRKSIKMSHGFELILCDIFLWLTLNSLYRIVNSIRLHVKDEVVEEEGGCVF